MYLCQSSLWPGFNSGLQPVILRDSSLADHILKTHPNPMWQKLDQYPLNDSTKPLEIEEETRNPTTDREWLR